jgi:hypothetical protein
MLVDSSASDDGSSSLDVTEAVPGGSPNKISLIYDGADDNAIKFSYWLTGKNTSGGSGGSGCSAGFSTSALFAVVLFAFAAGRKRQVGFGDAPASVREAQGPEVPAP